MNKRILKTTIIIRIIIAIVFFFGNHAFALSIPEDLVQDVNKAMKDGKALYDVYLKGPATGEATLQEIKEAKDKIKDFCDFEYNAYVVNTDEGNSIYFIGESHKPGEIVFGRHYKVTKETVVVSTVTCFVSPQPPSNAVGAYVTHPLSAIPTEFHVFLSLKHKMPIYIGTPKGIWKVELGKIEFSQEELKSNQVRNAAF